MRRHEAVVWVRCGRVFISAKSLAVVVIAGRGVTANNRGHDNVANCCSCLLSERESESPVTLGSDMNAWQAQ